MNFFVLQVALPSGRQRIFSAAYCSNEGTLGADMSWGLSFKEDRDMQVNATMTRDVRVANPNHSIREAATMMADLDAGIIPVGEHDRLVGMITDRDIAVRAVAQGKGPETRIGDVMSAEVKYCFEDGSAGAALAEISRPGGAHSQS